MQTNSSISVIAKDKPHLIRQRHKITEGNKSLSFHTMEFTDCTEEKQTSTLRSVRKKTVSFQKSNSPFCFGELFEIEVIR